MFSTCSKFWSIKSDLITSPGEPPFFFFSIYSYVSHLFPFFLYFNSFTSLITSAVYDSAPIGNMPGITHILFLITIQEGRHKKSIHSKVNRQNSIKIRKKKKTARNKKKKKAKPMKIEKKSLIIIFKTRITKEQKQSPQVLHISCWR